AIRHRAKQVPSWLLGTESTYRYASPVLFEASPTHQIGVRGSVPSPNSPFDSQVVTCKEAFTISRQTKFTICQINSTTSLEGKALDCYLPRGRNWRRPLSELKFNPCSKKGRTYSGVTATAFHQDLSVHKIIVTAGKIINSSDSIPTEGLTCAWSELRPVCEA
ncbi:hypothetical protein O181_058061, partial [Austropuccinia psidii MF-1]|nr:hypothetical protein [Austropuccinia psidii MF-1]